MRRSTGIAYESISPCAFNEWWRRGPRAVSVAACRQSLARAWLLARGCKCARSSVCYTASLIHHILQPRLQAKACQVQTLRPYARQ